MYNNITYGKYSTPICWEFLDDTVRSKAYDKALAIVINVINFAMRMILIKILTTIRKDTISG